MRCDDEGECKALVMVRMGRWSTWIARFSVNEVRIGVCYECDVDVQCVCSIMLVIDDANRIW